MKTVRAAAVLLIVGVLSAAFGMPAIADDTLGLYSGIQSPSRGGATLTVGVADGVAVTTPGQTGGFFFKRNLNIDSSFALRASAPTVRRIDTYFSDTLTLLASYTGVAAPTADTAKKVTVGDTAYYILSVTNLGNVTDSIGFVIDTAVVNGFSGIDTMVQWSLHFYDSRGVKFAGPVTTRGRDTAFIRLDPKQSDTIIVRVYADTSAPDTSWMVFRLVSYAANGNATKFAVRAYRGFNGDTYGGDGHDSITLYMELKAATKLRIARADTVVSGISLGGSTATSAADTQRRIPGAIVVQTLWFDNDDSSTADTIVLEDWIDTRYVRFDTAGLANPYAVSPQTAAAGTYVINSYGNIFRDSGMPTDTSGTAKFDVKIEYYESTGLTPLTASVTLERVGRIRWTITKSGGSGSILSAHNGDAAGSIDPAPLGIGAATDYDMGYVRYAVVIRDDSSPAKGPGRPDSGQIVWGDNTNAGVDSSFIEINNQFASRVTFGGSFTAEFLPKVSIVPETLVAQKIQQSNGDTFYFSHRVGNSGNGVDSIALSGTTAISGGYVTFLRDIGTVGAFDGIESRIDTFTVKSNDTVDILVAIYVPSSFTGEAYAYFRATSGNAYFYDTASDLVKVVGIATVAPDTAQTTVAGAGQPLTYSLFLSIPPIEDTIVLTLTNKAGVVVDSVVVTFDTAGRVKVLTAGDTVTYSDTTGVLTITLSGQPASDTLVWTVKAFDNDSGVVKTTFTDSGISIVDTTPPTTSDSRTSRLVSIDTDLSGGTDTAVTFKFYDTSFGDSTTGIDSIVITIRDTAGNIIKVDTIDYALFYQVPIDTTGAYTVQIALIDLAGNKTTLSDSVMFVITTTRTIALVAKDPAGVIQPDNVARGLRAQGGVTVSDPAANTNSATIQTITVTIVSDVDPFGISLELTESGANTGIFEGNFDFTNGVSNGSAKKVKVKDGSVVRAVYDADGPSGPIVSIMDQITWQAIRVRDVEKVRTWPNPYNPMVDPEMVFQSLPSDPNMSLEVYTLNGEKVKTLRVGSGITFTANENIARWDGRNDRGQMVASGTYVYLVRSTFGTKVSKFTLVK